MVLNLEYARRGGMRKWAMEEGLSRRQQLSNHTVSITQASSLAHPHSCLERSGSGFPVVLYKRILVRRAWHPREPIRVGRAGQNQYRSSSRTVKMNRRSQTPLWSLDFVVKDVAASHWLVTVSLD